MEHFENWLKNIYETQEEEISCTECFDQVSLFVELEASGQIAAAQLPQLKQHLDQCRACRDEYETLRDLRFLEETGKMPVLEDLRDLIR